MTITSFKGKHRWLSSKTPPALDFCLRSCTLVAMISSVIEWTSAQEDLTEFLGRPILIGMLPNSFVSTGKAIAEIESGWLESVSELSVLVGGVGYARCNFAVAHASIPVAASFPPVEQRLTAAIETIESELKGLTEKVDSGLYRGSAIRGAWDECAQKLDLLRKIRGPNK